MPRNDSLNHKNMTFAPILESLQSMFEIRKYCGCIIMCVSMLCAAFYFSAFFPRRSRFPSFSQSVSRSVRSESFFFFLLSPKVKQSKAERERRAMPTVDSITDIKIRTSTFTGSLVGESQSGAGERTEKSKSTEREREGGRKEGSRENPPGKILTSNCP